MTLSAMRLVEKCASAMGLDFFNLKDIFKYIIYPVHCKLLPKRTATFCYVMFQVLHFLNNVRFALIHS